MKTKHIIWIALPLLGAAAWYFLIRKGKGGGGGGATAITTNPDTNTTTPTVQKEFPLQRGSKGAKVKELQEALKLLDPSIVPDGDWGGLTDAAVRKHLGKGVVVGQEDINKLLTQSATIKKDAESLKIVSDVNSERKALAEKLKKAYDSNKKINLFAAYNTQVSSGNFEVGTGREINKNISVVKKDGKILGNVAIYKTYTTLFVYAELHDEERFEKFPIWKRYEAL